MALLLAQYKMEDAAAGVIEDALGVYPLTVTGTVPMVPAVPREGTSRRFDNPGVSATTILNYASGVIDATILNAALASCSASLWIRCTPTVFRTMTTLALGSSTWGAGGVAGNSLLAILVRQSTGEWFVQWGIQPTSSDSVTITTRIPTDGEWHHLVVTRNTVSVGVVGTDTTVRAYLDGVLVQTNATRKNPVGGSTSPKLFLGYQANVAGTSFYGLDGELDDVRFYSGELTAAEVLALSQAGYPQETIDVPSNPRDIRLDDDGDILVSSGDLALTGDATAVKQSLAIRLQFFAGEWFLDLDAGLPYFESILVKNPDLLAVRSLYRDVILETPGVQDLELLEFDYEGATRQLTGEYRATTDFGELNETFTLPEV